MKKHYASLLLALNFFAINTHAEHTQVHHSKSVADKGYFPGGDESTLPESEAASGSETIHEESYKTPSAPDKSYPGTPKAPETPKVPDTRVTPNKSEAPAPKMDKSEFPTN